MRKANIILGHCVLGMVWEPNNLFMRSKCPIKIGISVNLVITYSMVPTTSFIAWNPTWAMPKRAAECAILMRGWLILSIRILLLLCDGHKIRVPPFCRRSIYLFWRTWECEVKHKHGKKVLGGKAGIKISNVLCGSIPYLLYISTICKIDKTKD